MNYIQTMLLMVLAGILDACGTTLQAKDVQPSGFLSEYRLLLQPSQEDGALRTYKMPRTDWVAYKKIMLQPVTIREGLSSKLDTHQRRELYRLAGAFEDMLYLKLSKDYEMVENPTAGAMLIQVAITDAEESGAGPAFLSKALSQLQAVATIWTMEGGKPVFIGEVTAEFKIHDAQTGELLAVGADRRMGSRKLFDNQVFNYWDDVQNSLEFWTDLAAYRLCVLRGETSCVEPKA